MSADEFGPDGAPGAPGAPGLPEGPEGPEGPQGPQGPETPAAGQEPGPRPGPSPLSVRPSSDPEAGLPDEASLLAPLEGLHDLPQDEWPSRYARVLEDLSAALEEDA